MATKPRGWTSSPAGFARRVLAAAYEDNIFFLASALTFDALLAALPFALLVLSALGYVVQADEEAVTDVLAQLGRFIPSAGEGERDPFSGAERVLTAVASARGQLSIFGIPLFLWFSTRFFSSARAALNDVFDTRESRSWLRGKGIDFCLVLLTVILIVLNTVWSFRVVGSDFLGRLGASLSTFGLGVGFFVVVYVVAPTRRMRWDTALVAAAVASLAFGVGKWLYTIYVIEFATLDRLVSNTNMIAVLLLLVWGYFMACAFLTGAEVAEIYDMRRRQQEQRTILA